jgi:putative SOS response-associated peptidase YedK
MPGLTALGDAETEPGAQPAPYLSPPPVQQSAISPTKDHPVRHARNRLEVHIIVGAHRIPRSSKRHWPGGAEGKQVHDLQSSHSPRTRKPETAAQGRIVHRGVGCTGVEEYKRHGGTGAPGAPESVSVGPVYDGSTIHDSPEVTPMCARFTLQTNAETIAEVFSVALPGPLEPRYNITPTSRVLGVVHTEDGERLPWRFRWGLIPHWAKDPKVGVRMINARSETVATKPAFRHSYKRHRVLILADGYYEWRAEDGVKQPYHIRRIDRQPFAMAGIYAKWTPPDATEVLVSCSVLTTEPNALTGRIHHRMPVILDSEDYETWLDRSRPDADHLLRSVPESSWEAVPVHRRVGNVREGGPGCLEEVGPALRMSGD